MIYCSTRINLMLPFSVQDRDWGSRDYRGYRLPSSSRCVRSRCGGEARRRIGFDHILRSCRRSGASVQSSSAVILYLRRSMTFDVANTLACGIAGSRIDYCNALLVRASVTRRSTDFNECSTDSRVSFSTSGYASRTLTAVPLADLLRGLRRLPTESRIGFTIAVICFKSHRLEIPALSRIASSTT